ncbi:MAG: ATP-binding protein [Deltaproteobacteria bacterium]|nr:ATP-binding protein [Deltaproteobacteria bacterium]
MELNAAAILPGVDVRAAPPPPLDLPHAGVPTRGSLEEVEQVQRLRLVSFYSFALGAIGVGWIVAYVGYAALSRGASLSLRITLPATLLGVTGWFAFAQCRRGNLRAATWINVIALITSATINLSTIANAEGIGFITYCVAVSLAAPVIEGREWLWLAALTSVAALLGALLHSFPVVTPLVMPAPLAIGSTLLTATLGLGFPLGLFWLFSRNHHASREEAWALARHAAAANQRATAHARQLERRTEQLQAKNGELNDLLYVVSHDLRAPLINLEGFSRALEDSLGGLKRALAVPGAAPAAWATLEPEIDEALEFILRSVGKMDFLVRGLLELSRIDSRPHLAEPVDLAQQVDDVVASLRHSIDTRGISVRVDPLPSVTGDPVRIHQVFGNLIDNAVKYMRADGEKRIHVGVESRDGTPCFFVRDTGIGIRPEDHGKVFRLFSRVGSHGVAGDGLGLTAVKKIIERQGGKLWLESSLGHGSTFWFTLPADAGTTERTVADDGRTPLN